MPKPTPPKRTEAEILALLRKRHGARSGNGEGYAFTTHVREAAGFDSRRTIDALAMSLWPSRGLLVDAFEVKCSRSDWLREMRDPAKAEGFADRVDRFWLVTSDPSIVMEGELPTTWGLLVAQGNRLVQHVEAPMLRESSALPTEPLPPGLDRSFLACMLRAACRVGGTGGADVEEAVAAARQEEQADAEHRLQAVRSQGEELARRVEEFEQASGISIGYRFGGGGARVGAAVRVILDQQGASYQTMQQRLRRQADAARELADLAERQVAHLEAVEITRDGEGSAANPRS